MIEQFLDNKKIASDVTIYINEYIKESMKIPDFNIDNIFYTVDIDKHKCASYLCSTFCKASGGDYKKAIPVCASLELIHAHFLIIDDIVDDSTIRRGNKSNYLKFGLPTTLFSSDLLFSLSMENLNKLITEMNYNPKLFEVFIVKSRDVNIGQLLDYTNIEKTFIDFSGYYKCIDLKLGSLIQLSCLSGVLLREDYTQESLIKTNKFGKNLGRAFQIYDDVVDLIYENEYRDIINRNKTFPYVYTINCGSSRNKKALFEIYEKIIINKNIKDLMDIIVKIFEEERIAAVALDEMEKQISNALNNLEETEEIKELTNLCNHLLNDYKNKMKKYL